jgi:hypothetical protein
MRRAGLGLVVLACAATAAGCLFRADRPTVPDIVRALAPPLQPEGAIVDSVLIEQPLGDAFLDRELWAGVLPVGQPETRALFAENGLRAGVISGAGPQKFQALLESESDTVNPQRMTFQLRKEVVIPTAGPADPCRYFVLTDLAGQPRSVELKQARCGVLVRPQPVAEGRVRLWCEPQVQHGVRQEWFRPNEDGTRFTKGEEVPTEKYPVLGFEVLLEPDDYLLVGWSADEPQSLGEAAFAADAGGRPRQRVLVIRARHATPPRAADLPPIGGPFKRPSPAAQAAGRK